MSLPWTAPAAIGLAVWMFYVLDRLSDAARPQEVLAERHSFHHRYRFAFLGAVLGAVPALGLLVVLLPAGLRTAWMLLAMPLGVYAAAVHGLRLHRVPKEHLVGIFFGVATAMPLIASHAAPAAQIVRVVIAFGALCWLNCVAIARWEHADGLDHVTAWAAVHFRLVTMSVAGLALMLLPRQPAIAAACFLSAVALWMLEALRSRASAVTLRALADAALLTPLLVLPFVRT